MYEAIVMLLDQKFDAFMPAYVDELTRRTGEGQFGSKPTIIQKDAHLDLTLEGVNFTVHFNAEETVAEEASEIAENFAADHSDRDKIALTDSRLEISSGEDFDMVAFNSFISLIEAAEAIATVWHFDPAEGAIQ